MRLGSQAGGALRAAMGLLLLFCLLATCGEAYEYIAWQKCLGGSDYDFAESIRQTVDGGYVVAGRTFSNDGDVSGNHGDYDYWVVKLDLFGNLVWQKCLGGSQDDEAYSVQQTADGGYVVAGYTKSNDGDVSGNHGESDCWVVKLDTSGNMVWQRSLGGSSKEEAYSVQQTTDGGYVVGGLANSNDGDVSGNHGSSDCWVVKLAPSGNLVWQKSLGGSSWDSANGIQQTADGGYMVAGGTASNDYDVSGNHGESDFWVAKLDPSGNLIWQRCLGGSRTDNAMSIQQAADGGYVVAGYTNSDNGNVSGFHGSWDYWVVKLDPSGNLVWQKCLGGSGFDRAWSIQPAVDGGYVVAGPAKSNDGNVSGNHGSFDYWVLKLDPSGDLAWQKCLGGTDGDLAQSIQQTADGEYVVAGFTYSNDGDMSGNHGSGDFWILKLSRINCTIAAPDMACPGSTGNVASTAISGADYAWSITNGEITSSSNAQSIIFTAGSSGTTRLTVNITKDGYWNECHKDIAILPGPDCSWTANAPVCNGTPVQFDSPSGMDDYLWDFGDGFGSQAEDPVHLYVVPGTYVVNLTVANDCGSKSCSGTIEIKPMPDCSWTSDSPACNGTPVQLTGPAGMDSYNWDFGDGAVGSAQDASHLYSAAGTYTVSLKATKGGCSKTCTGRVEVRPMASCVQASYLDWQKCLGGSKDDHAYSIQQTADGGYVVVGYAQSNDGDVSGNHGRSDYWVVKLDPSGNLTWQKCLGGSKDEYAQSVQQTADGGYIIAGYSNSSNGDVGGNHGSYDCWIAKISQSGKLIWQKCLGGSQDEYAQSVQQTADGGYVVVGSTYSNDGDVSGNHGRSDYWVVKLDPSGNLAWQKCIGGNQDEYAQCVQQTADGGYVVAGYADSADGDVSGSNGLWDYWVVKLDPSGNLTWQKCIGGWDYDFAYSVQQTADSGYLVAGHTYSDLEEFSCHFGRGDFRIAKLNQLGNIEWQKCLGGSREDHAPRVRLTADGGYVVAGYTRSNDLHVSGNHGRSDYWVVKLDPHGDMIWQKCLGGSSDDEAYSVQQTTDGGYVAAGFAKSNDYDVSGNHGSGDFWIVKLGEINCGITAPDAVCPGSTGNIASSTAVSEAAYNWSITNGVITSGSNARSITFTAGSSGPIRLTVTVSKKCYYDEFHKDIAINSHPDCSWTSNAPVCNGTPVNFTGPAGMDDYYWEFGDNAVSSEKDPSHLYSHEHTYMVALTATKGSCTKVCLGEVVVTVPDCRWISNAPVCNGTPVQFTGPEEMESYNWNFGDNQTSTAKDPAHLYSEPGYYTVSLTVAKGGCSKNCSGPVIVEEIPDCRWTSNSPVCNGTPVNFTGPAEMVSHYWDFGDGQYNSSQNASHLYSAPGRYNVSLNVSKAGCAKTCMGPVIVEPIPDCNWTSNVPVCNGTPVQFNGT